MEKKKKEKEVDRKIVGEKRKWREKEKEEEVNWNIEG